MLVFHCAIALAAAAERGHPFLLVAPSDVERAREGMQRSAAFAGLAEDLTSRATTNRLVDLPSLERNWWQTAKLKPWRETYPEVFHHTWIVPLKWADLARNCARASLVSSPSLPLAAKGRNILLRLSDYPFEAEHYDVGMNYTLWVLAALDAYDILYNGFTAPERARLDAFFMRYLDAVRKNDDYWIEHEPGGRLNNHYAWHKLGLSMIGVFYDRPELVERALRGPKGVEQMLAEGFKDDGLWLEGSIPYQFAETTPLVIMAQMLANAGCPEDLFRYRSPNGHSLKQAYDALIPLLFPDRTLPTIGDCYARRAHIAESPDWETLFRRFREPAYAWLIADRKTRTPQALFNGAIDLPKVPPPALESRLWPEMGYVALRSNEGTNYWSGRGWSLFASFSGQPVHEHADKLSLILFADGHLWLPDLEARTSTEHAFSSLTQGQLNRQTVCHNTLLVDGRSQRLMGQRLDLIEFTNTAGLKRATIGDLQGRLYEGVHQLRTFIVTEGYVLDFFQAASAAPHEFAWLTHVDGKPAGGSLRATNTVSWPTGAPWSYLREPRGASAAAQVWECFSNSGQTFQLDVLADGPTEIVHCGFPRDDSQGAPTIPMRLFKRHGTKAWFLAAYRLVPKPDEPAELKVSPAGTESMNISLRSGGHTFKHAVPRLRLQ
ncbi:MAG TPA: alginate lyase family protein [Verrucomicrobiota bacterium]|nr:alginate lyase family protein [Verrucomicrobiota bacterium]